MKAAFRRIESAVSDVPEIHMTQHRVGLSHPLQHSDRGQPENYADRNSPPRSETEGKADSYDHSYEHQFAITAEDQVRAIRGLMNDDLPRYVAPSPI